MQDPDQNMIRNKVGSTNFQKGTKGFLRTRFDVAEETELAQIWSRYNWSHSSTKHVRAFLESELDYCSCKTKKDIESCPRTVRDRGVTPLQHITPDTLNKIKMRLKKKLSEDTIEYLDRPVQNWLDVKEFENYGISNVAGVMALKDQFMQIRVKDGAMDPVVAQRTWLNPTVREVIWWDRILTRVGESLKTHSKAYVLDIMIIASIYARRQLLAQLMGQEPDFNDLETWISGRPWESETQAQSYASLVEQYPRSKVSWSITKLTSIQTRDLMLSNSSYQQLVLDINTSTEPNTGQAADYLTKVLNDINLGITLDQAPEVGLLPSQIVDRYWGELQDQFIQGKWVVQEDPEDEDNVIIGRLGDRFKGMY